MSVLYRYRRRASKGNVSSVELTYRVFAHLYATDTAPLSCDLTDEWFEVWESISVSSAQED